MTTPVVTVVIPVKNEAERLGACLDALAGSDLARAQIEVLVVDGGSTDDTVDIARQSLSGRGWARAAVLHSPAGDRSSNLNHGLVHASASVLVRVDARSRIPANYVRRCLEVLETRPEVAVVGGRQRAVAAGRCVTEAGVARALNNRWAMGLARYRRGTTSGKADTVYLGAYRTTELRDVGGWHIDLPVNEDFDLNRRLARFGSVWFDAGLVVDYVPRSSLRLLARQYWAFGLGKARYWAVSGDAPRPRQLALLTAPVAALAALLGVLAAAGPAAAAALLLAGLATGVVVEVAGSDGPEVGLTGHILALAAIVCVAGSWLAGVAVGRLRPVAESQAIGGRPAERAV